MFFWLDSLLSNLYLVDALKLFKDKLDDDFFVYLQGLPSVSLPQ